MIPLVIAAFFLNQVLGTSIPVSTSQPEDEINISKRIVGGRLSVIRRHPWIAAIENNDSLVCGGSIISESVILTAAHCTKYPQHTLSVRVGTSLAGFGGWKHKVVEIRRHELFTSHGGRTKDDIALVKVSPPIQFGDTVDNVILANKEYAIVPNKTATIAGWGYTSERGLPSHILRNTSVLIIDTMECAKAIGESPVSWTSSSGQICAAAPGRDACNGDSGGPLMQGSVQIGIVSWGLGCARSEYPGVYTNITFYRDWIDENWQLLTPLKKA